VKSNFHAGFGGSGAVSDHGPDFTVAAMPLPYSTGTWSTDYDS
jgi:hypothetical protein